MCPASELTSLFTNTLRCPPGNPVAVGATSAIQVTGRASEYAWRIAEGARARQHAARRRDCNQGDLLRRHSVGSARRSILGNYSVGPSPTSPSSSCAVRRRRLRRRHHRRCRAGPPQLSWSWSRSWSWSWSWSWSRSWSSLSSPRCRRRVDIALSRRRPLNEVVAQGAHGRGELGHRMLGPARAQADVGGEADRMREARLASEGEPGHPVAQTRD
jgi:hypothetical protein